MQPVQPDRHCKLSVQMVTLIGKKKAACSGGRADLCDAFFFALPADIQRATNYRTVHQADGHVCSPRPRSADALTASVKPNFWVA